ncbi:MAG TPA: LamG-like jellyroll fold domain-containing protein, partial [Bacteroidia bacterium]|nr:LamG-like jellyroll fold domain-containing protein [Bacteroidia bacterium]
SISQLISTTLTPVAGNASAVLAANCGAFAPQLSISGYAPGDSSGFSYQWMSSTDNSTFAPVATANNNTYNDVVNGTLYYNCVVSCPSGGGNSTSTSQLVDTNPTPTAGAVSAVSSSGCGTFAPQLSLSGASNPSLGFSYQWMSSTDNITFAPIATATNTTYNGLTNSNLYYTCQLSCTSTNTVNATSELISINPTPSITTSACSSLTTTLTASGGTNFTWTPSASLDTDMGSVVVATATAATNYVVTNAEGCSSALLVSATDVLTIDAQTTTACTSTNDTLYANAFLNKGLVAYYPFNGNANDFSGNGHNGTTVGVSLATDRFGNSSKCYSFAGTSTYITCPPATYFTGGDFTISGWVNATSVDTWGRLMDFGNGAGVDNVLVALNAGGSTQLLASAGNNFQSNQVLNNNVWVQVLFTYHANTQNGICYYNGNLIDSGYMAQPANVIRNLNYIGLSNWAGDGGVYGSMDDIRIYGRALSTTEVGQLYNYELTSEAQTTYNWSTGAITPYIVSNSSTPSTATYTVSQTRNGANCSISNTATVTTVACPAALNFDGANDYVNLGGGINTAIQGTNLITVEAWVNPSTTGSFGVIAGNYDNINNGGMQFLLRRDGSNYTFWVDNGSGFNPVTSSTSVVTNVWQHVAGTWDGNNLNIYINGVLDNTSSGITGAFSAQANNVWIGTDGANEAFTGSMDEIHIWNVALTQAQIQNDLGCIHSGTVTPVGLLASYNFDNGMSNVDNTGKITLADATGNGNNGTLNNFALNGNTSNWVDDAGMLSAKPIITSVVATNTAICIGATTTLTVNGNATTYTWNANATSATTTTVSITPANTDTYTVIGANNYCYAMDSVVVAVNALPTVSVTTTNSVVCDGAMITLSGAGASTYTWTGAVVDNTSFTPAVGVDSYTVTGTDGNGCTGKAVQTVTVNALPTVTASATNMVICLGDMTTLNGTGADTYTWTGSVVDGTPFSPSVGVNSYTVTGTENINGCTNMAVQTVTVNTLPTVTVNSPSICVGSAATLIASGTATTYTWNTTATTLTISVTPTTPTDYTVSGTDANGCVNIATATVTVNALPTITVNSPNICTGNTATLTANGTATTYTWSTNATTAAINVTPTTPTNYTVNGTDANGCVNMATATVSINALPTVTVNSPSICVGNTATLTANGTATTYTWSTNATTAAINVTPATPTDYTVNGTDANGCVNMATATVSINALPTVSVTSSTVSLCIGSSATLTASGTATTYTWSTTDIGATTVVSPTVNATYTVTGANGNNCQNTTVYTQTVSTTCGVGIAKYNNDATISVYPNPSTGVYNIVLDTETQLVVTNALGQVLFTKTVKAGTETIDVQNEVGGVYFVKVIQHNNQQTIKLIKN